MTSTTALPDAATLDATVDRILRQAAENHRRNARITGEALEAHCRARYPETMRLFDDILKLPVPGLVRDDGLPGTLAIRTDRFSVLSIGNVTENGASIGVVLESAPVEDDRSAVERIVAELARGWEVEIDPDPALLEALSPAGRDLVARMKEEAGRRAALETKRRARLDNAKAAFGLLMKVIDDLVARGFRFYDGRVPALRIEPTWEETVCLELLAKNGDAETQIGSASYDGSAVHPEGDLAKLAEKISGSGPCEVWVAIQAMVQALVKVGLVAPEAGLDADKLFAGIPDVIARILKPAITRTEKRLKALFRNAELTAVFEEAMAPILADFRRFEEAGLTMDNGFGVHGAVHAGIRRFDPQARPGALKDYVSGGELPSFVVEINGLDLHLARMCADGTIESPDFDDPDKQNTKRYAPGEVAIIRERLLAWVAGSDPRAKTAPASGETATEGEAA